MMLTDNIVPVDVEEIRKITFEAEGHTYTDEHGQDYTSATTLIGNYAPKFDTEFWAAKKAAQESKATGKVVTAEQIKRRWQDITDKANAKGNKQHDYIENSINEQRNNNTKLSVHNLRFDSGRPTDMDSFNNSRLKQSLPSIHDTITRLLRAGYRVHAEKRVYSAYYGIAGMIDCLLVHPNGEFIILDWKTNKHKMMFEAGYFNKDKRYNNARVGRWMPKTEFMFDPISHLPSCNGTKYTLQLSLYAFICELWGLKCKRLAIYHIRDGYPLQTQSGTHFVQDYYAGAPDKITVVEPYKVPYMKSEIKNLLEHNKAMKNGNS